MEPVKDICKRVLECGYAYLKHRTYVNNCAITFPLIKEAYDGMYIELDFSQNLALRPKDEVQSAHFSGKQVTLHCSIVDPVGYRYHFHLSDDTKMKIIGMILAGSKNVGKKKCQILPTEIAFSPDEVFDTYIEFSEDYISILISITVCFKKLILIFNNSFSF